MWSFTSKISPAPGNLRRFPRLEVEHERDWQCFLKSGNQGIALFEVDDGEEVHGGSEVNHTALRLDSGEYERSKQHWRTPGSKSAGRKAIRVASTSTIPMAISCSS